jgi:hypothetical protein
MVALAGATTIELRVAVLTVSVTAAEVVVPKVAVIAEVPANTAVATPPVFGIVAAAGVPDFQVTLLVKSRELPSE